MCVTNIARRPLALVPALMLLLGLTATARAHEGREVGPYELTVGFSGEPALVNEPNGLYLLVHRAGDETATIEGLQDTLQVEISYAGETKPLEIRPVLDEPGNYTADIYPTAVGAYTFRIFGTIESTQIDESFTSGPETFAEIESPAAIAIPSIPDDATGGSGTASDAQDTADSARTLAIVGIIIGVLGLAAGAAGTMMAINARGVRSATASAPRDHGD